MSAIWLVPCDMCQRHPCACEPRETTTSANVVISGPSVPIDERSYRAGLAAGIAQGREHLRAMTATLRAIANDMDDEDPRDHRCAVRAARLRGLALKLENP